MLCPYVGLQDDPIEDGESCALDEYFAPGAVNDPHWASVTLMLHMNGSNGGTTFTDSSPAARSPLTVSNVQTLTAVKKFGTAAGAAVAGSAILEYAASSDFQYDGAATWTIEFFLLVNSLGSPQQRFLGQRTGSGRFFQITTGGLFQLVDADGTTLSMGGTLHSNTTGTWFHVAVTCDGTSVRSFINGDLITTQTATTFNDATTTDFSIFSAGSTWTTDHLRGYIDELRITRGVCRYKAGYTIPQSAYPDALEPTWDDSVPRTCLLLQFEDSETVVASMPGTASAADVVSYNGETASATVNDATAVSYTAGGFAFTIDNTNNYIRYVAEKLDAANYSEFEYSCDAIAYGTPSGTSGSIEFMSMGVAASEAKFGWAFSINAGSPRLVTIAYDSANNDSTLTGYDPTQQHHYAIRIYENGLVLWIIDGTVVRTSPYNYFFEPHDFQIGPESGATGGLTSCVLSSVKVVSRRKLDRTLHKTKIARLTGSAELSADQRRFGTHSLYVPGSAASTHGLYVEAHDDLKLGTLNWTLEGWVYRSSHALAGTVFVGPGNTSNRLSVGTDGLFDITYANAVSSTVKNDVASLPLDTWTHIAMQRNGANLQTFVAGTLVDTTAVPGGSGSDQGATNDIHFGRVSGTGATFGGYFDEWRITRGVARYSGSFTPPSLPACAYGGDDSTPPVSTPVPPPASPSYLTIVSATGISAQEDTLISAVQIASVSASFTVTPSIVVANLPAGLVASLSWTPGLPGTGSVTVTGTVADPAEAHVQVTYIDEDSVVIGCTFHTILIYAASPAPAPPAPAPVPVPPPGVPVGDADLGSVLALLRFEDAGALTPQPSQQHFFYAPGLAYFDLPEAVLDAYSFEVLEVVDGGTFDSGPTSYGPESLSIVGRRVTIPGLFGTNLHSCSYRVTRSVVTSWANERAGDRPFLNQGGESSGSIVTGKSLRIGEGKSAFIVAPDTWDMHDSAGGMTVECFINIDPSSPVYAQSGKWLSVGVFSPVLSASNKDGRLVWALGILGYPVISPGSPTRRAIVPVMVHAMATGSYGSFIGAGRELRPELTGGFHLSGVVQSVSSQYRAAVWAAGVRGQSLATAPSGFLAEYRAGGVFRVGGVCAKPGKDPDGWASRVSSVQPLIASIDEVRITATARYSPNTSELTVTQRTPPWPNY